MKHIITREKRKQWDGYMLIAPAVFLILITFIAPLVYSFIISLSEAEAIIANKVEFVGLSNYISVIKASKFQEALLHTCLFVVATIILELGIGFVVAMLLYKETPGFRIFKLILAIPLMVAPVVSGLQWRWMFADQYGIINRIISMFGIEPPLWFGSTSGSWITIIIGNLWLATPFVILVLLAGLGGLSEEMHEAAEIDGANRWQNFRKIILPQLKPTILIILVIRITDAFRIYDLIYILTGGGPGGKTEVLSTYIYKRIFTDWELGKGAAASFIVTIIICLLSFICNKIMENKED